MVFWLNVHMLSCFGISGNLPSWIDEFLDNRTQCLRVGSTISSPRQLMSGVVQGSVLGCLLFLLHVDDVVKLFSSGMLCKLYADDMKLCSVIRTVQSVQGASELQSSLDALVAWSEECQRSVSSTKSAVLHLGQNTVHQCYKIKQASISSVTVMRDLGILTDIKLTISQHICTIVNKAHSRASLIFKCFHSGDWTTLLKAFVTYVRPLLDYAYPMWSPSTITDIAKIESVR